MPEVLIINDTESKSMLLEEALGENFHCTRVKSLTDAEKILKNIHFDGILVNLHLKDSSSPLGVSGLNFLQDQKNITKKTPVFVISDKENQQENQADKISAFSLGATDFINMPMDPVELRVRVASRIQKNSYDKAESDSPVFEKGPLKLNQDDQVLILNDFKIKLTGLEFRLMLKLAKNAEKPLSRELLTRELGLETQNQESRKVDAHVSNLRKKLGVHGRLIGSVYGRGYVFRSNFL